MSRNFELIKVCVTVSCGSEKSSACYAINPEDEDVFENCPFISLDYPVENLLEDFYSTPVDIRTKVEKNRAQIARKVANHLLHYLTRNDKKGGYPLHER